MRVAATATAMNNPALHRRIGYRWVELLADATRLAFLHEGRWPRIAVAAPL